MEDAAPGPAKLPHRAHTTADEIAFLRSLGQHAAIEQTRMTREQLLAAYIVAISGRRVWGDISPALVFSAAKEMLGEA